MRAPVVLVLRGSDAFSDKLKTRGLEVINLELIRTELIVDTGEIAEMLTQLDRFDGLFFTSPHAAEAFVKIQRAFDGDIYVLGDRAKKVFDNAGINVRSQPQATTAAAMIEAFGAAEFSGKRFLFVRGDKSMRTIPDMLAGKAEIEELIVYRTIDQRPDLETERDIRARLENREIDWLCFFSPSGVDSFGKIFDTTDLIGVNTAVIGQTTAGAAEAAGLNVNFVSQRTRAEDFADDLIEHIKQIA